MSNSGSLPAAIHIPVDIEVSLLVIVQIGRTSSSLKHWLALTVEASVGASVVFLREQCLLFLSTLCGSQRIAQRSLVFHHMRALQVLSKLDVP